MVDFTIRDSQGTKIGSINQNVDVGLMVGQFLAMREEILIGKTNELLQLAEAIWENTNKLGEVFNYLIQDPPNIHPKLIHEEYLKFVNNLRDATTKAPDYFRQAKKYIKYFNSNLAPLYQEGTSVLTKITDSLNVLLELDSRWKEAGKLITYVNESQIRLEDEGFSEEMYDEGFTKLHNQFIDVTSFVQDYHKRLVEIINQAEEAKDAQAALASLRELDSEFPELQKAIDRCYKLCDSREKMANRILNSGYVGSGVSIGRELEKLAKLREQNQITEEEFTKFKRKLLD